MKGKNKYGIPNASEIDTLALGSSIKNQRLDKDFTQLSVADSIDIKRQNLSMIESGKYTPSLITMIKIACATDYDLNNLKTLLVKPVKVPDRNKRVFMKKYNAKKSEA